MQNEAIHAAGAAAGTRETREPDPKDGIFGTWIHLAVGMTESSIRTTTRVSRTVLGEIKAGVNALIGFVDHANQSLVRGARSVNEGAFGLADEAAARGERAFLVVLRQTQYAGDRASELAAATSQAIVGSRGAESGPIAH
jgi:hypothetical protein